MREEQSFTLRQGVEQFHKENKGYLSHDQEGISSDARIFFESHDIAHVLFDCDISLFGEGAVKIWTIFGTTLGFWKHIGAYREANAFELSKKISLADFVSNIFKLLTSIPLLIIRARSMEKRWPWSGFEPYLDTPVSEIRKEFNIHVLEIE